MIYNRLEGENKNVDKWIDALHNSLAKYNLSHHSRLPNMSPYDAQKTQNKTEVMFNNYNNHKQDVKYPLLSVNDDVRVAIKKNNQIQRNRCQMDT